MNYTECNKCFITKSNFKRHFRAKNNIDASNIICEHSQKSINRKDNSERVSYSCDICKYIASQISSIKEHKESVHDGQRYPCHKCDYKATSKSHDAAPIHNVQRYPCDQCDYKATLKQSLKLHVSSVHKGQRWPCDQCDYKLTAKQSLR